ncbi:MAG: DMT family transporter [Candidatus Thermoplasmatota archaeon]|nr:DMT family transporter [Candidatus Thermoplasmatota archaeon]
MGKAEEPLLFLAMSSFWGINYVFLKVALNYETPFYTLLFRILFALIFALVFFRSRIAKPAGLSLNLKLFTFSILNITAFMGLWFYGETTVSAGLSSVLVYTYPLFTVLLSRIFLRETITLKIIIGVIVGFAGVVVTFSGAFTSGFNAGAILLILSAIMWAVGTIYYKKNLSRENPWTVNTFQYVYAIPVILVLALVTGRFSVEGFTYEFYLSVLFIGSVGTTFAYFIYLLLYARYKASSISSFFFLVPALSLLFSYLILHEVLSYQTIIGFSIISVGIYLGSGSVKRESSDK